MAAPALCVNNSSQTTILASLCSRSSSTVFLVIKHLLDLWSASPASRAHLLAVAHRAGPCGLFNCLKGISPVATCLPDHAGCYPAAPADHFVIMQNHTVLPGLQDNIKQVADNNNCSGYNPEKSQQQTHFKYLFQDYSLWQRQGGYCHHKG